MEKNNYFEALLYLLRVIVYADGVFDEDEANAILYICKKDSISDEYYNDFNKRVESIAERELYIAGIDLVHSCTIKEQLRIFVWLYKMAEVDGKIHVKEVRFLLYSIRQADIEFAQVENEAKKTPSIRV